MSSTYLIGFKDGVPFEDQQYRNAWLGAAFIWNEIFDRYMKTSEIPHDNWMSATMKNDQRSREFWGLAKRNDLPPSYRAVFGFTFDNCLLLKKDFLRFATDLEEFAAEFDTERKSHLRVWADWIRSHSELEAIGLHATSVNQNPWYEWDEGKEESIPYDMRTGGKHWSLYDELIDTDATVNAG